MNKIHSFFHSLFAAVEFANASQRKDSLDYPEGTQSTSPGHQNTASSSHLDDQEVSSKHQGNLGPRHDDNQSCSTTNNHANHETERPSLPNKSSWIPGLLILSAN